MADEDMLCDALGHIVQFIGKKIRFLFEFKPNEFNYPNWVQATLLFGITVAPMDEIQYFTEELYDLAQKLLTACKEHGYNASTRTNNQNREKWYVWEDDLIEAINEIQDWKRRYEENQQLLDKLNPL